MIWKRSRGMSRAGYKRMEDGSGTGDTSDCGIHTNDNHATDTSIVYPNTVQSNTIFSAKLRCGCCGAYYGPKIWISTTKFRRVVWQCNARYRKDDPNNPGKKLHCSSPVLMEPEIESAFVRAVDIMAREKDTLLTSQTAELERLKDMTDLEAEQKTLTEQMAADKAAVDRMIAENTMRPQDQEEYSAKYTEIENRYNAGRNRCQEIQEEMGARKVRARELERFIDKLETLESVTEFDEGLWSELVDHVTVHTKENIVFSMVGGVEIEV